MGSVLTVKRYWIFQFHVMFEGSFSMKLTNVAVPEALTEPVPFHPSQKYRVPVDPAIGDAIEASISLPDSNHPLVGVGEPYVDMTAR
jgi:hypothetical protein